jgi:hypothetical protein
MALLGLAIAAPAPVAASTASVSRLDGFGTVVAVAMAEDFPIASLMRANCSGLIRIERPDGSSSEVMDCELSSEPVMIPAFQGVPPTQALIVEGGACEWISDYWATAQGILVFASSYRFTVTPSGHVHARSEYPAAPLACE